MVGVQLNTIKGEGKPIILVKECEESNSPTPWKLTFLSTVTFMKNYDVTKESYNPQ